MSAAQPTVIVTEEVKPQKSNEIYQSFDSNEYVFAVVGHVGSGTSEVARQLELILTKHPFSFEKGNVFIL